MNSFPDPADSTTSFRKLARTLTIIENDLEGYEDILKNLSASRKVPVIGITGPPGAGKSTLVNALINQLSVGDKRIAVLAVDPTSPFTYGSLLGDRIRMKDQFEKKEVFIRSVATRGSLGGLSAKVIEMTDVLKNSGFDYILVETVGVGQSEVEIAALADITIVVLVPESGDEIQIIKSGLMEIADAFAVNKADRPGSATFINAIKKFVSQKGREIPVFATVASRGEGIDKLTAYITGHTYHYNAKAENLLSQKAWTLIQKKLTSKIDRRDLQDKLTKGFKEKDFNLYRFVEDYLMNS